MKHIRKVLFFCIVAVVAILSGALLTCQKIVGAETLTAQQRYASASTQMKGVESYNKENKTQIVDILQEYSSSRANYKAYCEANSEEFLLDNEAQKQYFVVNYQYASDEILSIKHFTDDKVLAESVMLLYKNAWTDVRENNLESIENIDANAKYYSLYDEKENMKDIVIEPEPLEQSYVYDGQLQTFKFDGMFDPEIMKVENNQQRDAGIYKVVVSLKDRNHYEWAHAGHSGTLEFVWVIQKASLEDRIDEFEDKTFVEDGSEKSLVATARMGSIRITYSDNNSQSKPGIYKIKATFSDVSNNYEVAVRYATMTIKPASFVQKNESTDIDQVIVEQDGGFDPMMSLEVTTITNEGLKYGDVNYSKHIFTNEEVAVAYEIDLVREGESIQPEGELTVKMYIPETVQGKRFRILHTHYTPLQTVKEVDYILSGNYAVISTNELSQFAFVVEKEESKTLSVWALAGIVCAICIGVLLCIYLIMFLIWKFAGKSLTLFEASFRRFSKLICGTKFNKVELSKQEKQVEKIS